MINNQIFVPWDLTFGSGMQTLGALVAAVTVGWAMKRGDAMQRCPRAATAGAGWLYLWIRWVIPGALLSGRRVVAADGCAACGVVRADSRSGRRQRDTPAATQLSSCLSACFCRKLRLIYDALKTAASARLRIAGDVARASHRMAEDDPDMVLVRLGEGGGGRRHLGGAHLAGRSRRC
jgi:hypothetical protein